MAQVKRLKCKAGNDHDNVRRIWDRKQRTDIGKYYFVKKDHNKLEPTTGRSVRDFLL